MQNLYNKLIEKYHYTIESIKNRYPCKIIGVKTEKSSSFISKIKYQAATKNNIRESTPKEILDDILLVEKFHPTETVKLGFIAFGEVILKDSKSIEEAKIKFEKISKKMFEDLL